MPEDPLVPGPEGRKDRPRGHLGLTSAATARNRSASSCCRSVPAVPE